MSRQPSRTITGLRQGADEDANALVQTLRHHGIDHASTLTIPWDRRHLLDVCLLLAQRHVDFRLGPPHGRLGSVTRSDRIDAEEARWTEEAAHAANGRYNMGLNDSETLEGRRVYQRRTRRARVQREMAELGPTG